MPEIYWGYREWPSKEEVEVEDAPFPEWFGDAAADAVGVLESLRTPEAPIPPKERNLIPHFILCLGVPPDGTPPKGVIAEELDEGVGQILVPPNICQEIASELTSFESAKWEKLLERCDLEALGWRTDAEGLCEGLASLKRAVELASERKLALSIVWC